MHSTDWRLTLNTPADFVLCLQAMKKHPAVTAYLTAFARKGGKARAAKLTKAQRSDIARKAAKARWSQK